MDWKKTLATVAPTLATAFGGPLAGLAANVAMEALGVDSEDKLEAAVLSGDPQALFKLKEAEQNLKIKMRELGIEESKLAVDDRKSAREMFRVNIWPQITLSVLFIGGYLALIFMIFSGQFALNDSIRDMANILLGVLTSGIPMILRFWFGGSPNDDEQMNKIYNSVPK